MDKYEPGKIEPKWVKRWEEEGFYQAIDPPTGEKLPKKYLLIEFPYPSGERLHVGHGRSFTAIDALARKYRMEGFNVLYPFGWDAFGLPAENYAIKTGINPQITTAQNIANAKTQAKRWGLSFDWSREINTTDPNYYRWTQWIFLKLFEKGLAYRSEVPVNWCPTCKTNLADEEVLADQTHERCGQKTEKRLQKQWLLRITAYADRLLEDLKTVDYLPKIAQQQINWIGRSEGVEIEFKVQSPKFKVKTNNQVIRVFTTAPDTIFGATFVVLSPEYAQKFLDLVPQEKKETLLKYIKTSLNKSEEIRKIQEGEKTGIEIGIKVINPFNNQEIPVFVADYVLGSYGTGAIMGVPAHDLRDYQFAKKYHLPIIPVIKPTKDCRAKVGKDGFWDYEKEIKTKYQDQAILFHCGKFDNLTSRQARREIIKEVEKRKIGRKKVNYHLRDWVFSRQHYWGEPIPIIYCSYCLRNPRLMTTEIKGEKYAVVPVPEDQLPVELPYLENYQPTGTGESPLAAVKEWVNTKCPICGGPAKRETDTMPNWAGSNWYYLGYLVAKDLKKDKNKNQKFIDIFSKNKKILEYWMPVDLYNGGMEHTTLHLLYSRFIYKFLYDLKVVPTKEPYAKRRSHGVVLGPDNQKMSKSRGNVINPDEVIAAYGADTFRLYESFMGPFDQTIAWSQEGVEGCFRFLKRVWRLSLTKADSRKTNVSLLKKLHQAIKKVGEDLENLKFNTAIAYLMEFVNAWQEDKKGLAKEDLKNFLLILAPFAPFITEELWQRLFTGQNKKKTSWSIHQQPWPKYDPNKIEEEETTILIEVNGKIRDRIKLKTQDAKLKSEVQKQAFESEKVKKYLEGKKPSKVIFIPGKLINFVV